MISAMMRMSAVTRLLSTKLLQIPAESVGLRWPAMAGQTVARSPPSWEGLLLAKSRAPSPPTQVEVKSDSKKKKKAAVKGETEASTIKPSDESVKSIDKKAKPSKSTKAVDSTERTTTKVADKVADKTGKSAKVGQPASKLQPVDGDRKTATKSTKKAKADESQTKSEVDIKVVGRHEPQAEDSSKRDGQSADVDDDLKTDRPSPPSVLAESSAVESRDFNLPAADDLPSKTEDAGFGLPIIETADDLQTRDPMFEGLAEVVTEDDRETVADKWSNNPSPWHRSAKQFRQRPHI